MLYLQNSKIPVLGVETFKLLACFLWEFSLPHEIILFVQSCEGAMRPLAPLMKILITHARAWVVFLSLGQTMSNVMTNIYEPFFITMDKIKK